MVEHAVAAAAAAGAAVRVTPMASRNVPTPIEQMLDLMIESTSLTLAPYSFGAWLALAWIRAFDASTIQRRGQPPLSM